ncbi:MAG: hypothetical protein VKK32_07340 [Candidatus Melainabacteria bacterium]|nr:hypothetical protein [Candidatus Melainabacteria bacterium]
MRLENKLNITSQVELAKAEEKISKQKAKQLFDSGDIDKVEVGTFKGRATRIWLDLILKKELKQVIDWNVVDKDDYISAMQRSVVKNLEIKALLKNALANQINDRALFMKGIDVSYYYEGYSEFKTEEL